MLVPDDVHDSEPAGHRVLVAVGVGGEQPLEQRLDLRHLVGVLVADRPVPGAAFLVLAGAADLAAADDAVVAGALVGLQDQRAELHHAGLRLRVALRLRLVGREVLDRCAELRRLGNDRRRRRDGDSGEGDGQHRGRGGQHHRSAGMRKRGQQRHRKPREKSVTDCLVVLRCVARPFGVGRRVNWPRRYHRNYERFRAKWTCQAPELLCQAPELPGLECQSLRGAPPGWVPAGPMSTYGDWANPLE